MTADSPIRWYRLDDLPGSGAVDESGHASAGTYAGTPRYGTAGSLASEPSTSVQFNTSDDDSPADQYATLPTVQLDTGDFTVEGWFKTTTPDGGGAQRIWMSGTGSPLSHYVTLAYSGRTVTAKATDGTNTASLSGTPIYGDGAWHHAAFTRAGTTFSLYIDGTLVQSTTASVGDVDSASTSAYIGRSAAGDELFKGSIDEVAVYTSALGSTRVAAHAKDASVNCSNISGATSSTYTSTTSDRGKRLNVNVTASNGTAITASSKQTNTVWDAAPAQDIPVDGGMARSVTPTLKVNAISGGTYDYSIELADSDKFEKVIAASGWQTSGITWTVGSDANLKDGKSYFWRARARSTNGTTLWSAARSLQVKVKRLGLRDAWPIWKAGPLGVNEATGNLILSLPGPSYASVADGFQVSATYNSMDTTDNGLGAGWTLNAGPRHPVKLVDHSLVTNPQDRFDSAEVVWADGSSDYFSHAGGAKSDIYTAPPGSSMRLSKNKDDSWTLNDTDGSVYSFGAANGSGDAEFLAAEITSGQPGKAKLTYTYNDTPIRLTQITDPAGRTLLLKWDSLTPGSCSAALLCITGPDGVVWKYVGSGSGGTSGSVAKVNDGTRDLLQITYGTNGKPSQIQNANDLDSTHASPGYDSTHKVAVSYDTNNLVTTVTEGPITGQSPSTSTWTFAYHPGAVTTSATAATHGDLASGTTRTADGYTEITPPRQYGQTTPKKTVVYYDDLDHPIDTVDLLGHHTRSSYTRSDQLEWTEDQDGNPTDYTYDPVTNLLTSKTDPDPDGAGSQTRGVTSYRYDELTVGTASSPGLAMQGLHAAYFANANFTGRPAVEETDPTADFNWGVTGPAALTGRSDNYSVRWTGILTIPSGQEATTPLPLSPTATPPSQSVKPKLSTESIRQQLSRTRTATRSPAFPPSRCTSNPENTRSPSDTPRRPASPRCICTTPARPARHRSPTRSSRLRC